MYIDVMKYYLIYSKGSQWRHIVFM